MKEIKKAAIYHMSLDPIRSSCIDLQMDILRSYSKKQEWEIYGEYLDLTNATTKKEDFKRLLEEADNFDVVVLKNCYFISRKTPEFVKYRNLLRDKGVYLYSLTEGWC